MNPDQFAAPNPEQDALLRSGGRGFLLAFYAALRSLKIYPLENATAQRSLDDLLASARALLDRELAIEVRLSGDFIFVNQTRLRLELDNYASFSHILTMFRAFEIGTLRIAQQVERREFQALIGILLTLAARPETAERHELLLERLAAAQVSALEVERELTHDEEESQDDQQRRREVAKRTYSQGVAVTKDVIGSMRFGRAANLRRVKRAVQTIVDQVLNNETSIMGLTTIRDYDEYTFTHSVNVCIFAVALGKKLGFSRLQLYDLGLTALMHDVGKARIPLEVLNKTSGLDEREWRVMQAHPWFGTLSLFELRGYEETPYRSILVAHEHHMKTDLSGYPKAVRPRKLGLFSRIVSVADGFDAATTRRSYQTVPIEPDQVLREMWENPRRGYDAVIVKGLINLIGIYPIGTCVILDTMEVGVVSGAPIEGQPLNRPNVRVAIGMDGALVAPPGELVALAEQDAAGNYLRSIIKVTNPQKYGLTVGDYFI